MEKTAILLAWVLIILLVVGCEEPTSLKDFDAVSADIAAAGIVPEGMLVKVIRSYALQREYVANRESLEELARGICNYSCGSQYLCVRWPATPDNRCLEAEDVPPGFPAQTARAVVLAVWAVQNYGSMSCAFERLDDSYQLAFVRGKGRMRCEVKITLPDSASMIDAIRLARDAFATITPSS